MTQFEDGRRGPLVRSTAEGAALLRAAGHLLADPAVRGPDDLAAALIEPGLGAGMLVKLPVVRRFVPGFVERVIPGGVWFEVARTRGFDDLVREEVAAGAEQVIVLGAGLDSRAYRMADELAGTRVFEVDHPVTAAHKRSRLARVVGAPPDNVTFVEVDFEREELGAALVEGGVDPGVRTVVVWSGVTPYLEDEAVAATLDWFATLAPGSALGFDYVWREVLEDEIPVDRGRARRVRRMVALQGEPFRWGIPRGGARALLESHGLELVEDVGPEEATRRYLIGSDGHPAGRLWRFGGFVRARVPGRS